MKFSPKILLLCFCLPLMGQASASQEAITIEADQLEINQLDGRSQYHGTVMLQQGQLQLQADSLQIEQQAGQLKRAIADGLPVRLQLPDEQSDHLIRAEANHMDFHFEENVVELKGRAVMWRGGDEFRGEHLIYHIDTRSVQAFGQAGTDNGDGRVRIILQPPEKNP